MFLRHLSYKNLLITTHVVYICCMAEQQIPSDGELLLLQALWEQPGATVQFVHEWVSAHGKDVGYTTTLTQLQRMHRKGLVSRERVGKQHHYQAVTDRATTEAALIERMTQTAFDGSPVKLALRALGETRPTQDEIDELSRWLDAQKDEI